MSSEELNRSLVAIDVDGTLSGSSGPISTEMIKRLNEKGIFWGILCSRSRDRTKMVTDEMKIQPRFTEVCRVYQRCEELRVLRDEFSGYQQYIYVADTPQDEEETLKAGWRFCYASRFEELLDAL